MRLIIINRKTIYTILVVLLLIVISIIAMTIYNRAEETFNPDVHYQGNIDDKVIAFACNVDWGNEYIPPMLEIFKDNNINITFFVTGRWADRNKDILKQIYDAKHEIGNHGYNHVDYDKLSYDGNLDEINKADKAIKDVINKNLKYFAPPSGAYNDNTIKAAKDLGYSLIMWSIDTIDWRQDSTKDIIIKRVTEKAHNSAIVLMHPTEETVKALPAIIDFMLEKGYKIGTISDIIQ